MLDQGDRLMSARVADPGYIRQASKTESGITAVTGRSPQGEQTTFGSTPAALSLRDVVYGLIERVEAENGASENLEAQTKQWKTVISHRDQSVLMLAVLDAAGITDFADPRLTFTHLTDAIRTSTTSRRLILLALAEARPADKLLRGQVANLRLQWRSKPSEPYPMEQAQAMLKEVRSQFKQRCKDVEELLAEVGIAFTITREPKSVAAIMEDLYTLVLTTPEHATGEDRARQVTAAAIAIWTEMGCVDFRSDWDLIRQHPLGEYCRQRDLRRVTSVLKQTHPDCAIAVAYMSLLSPTDGGLNMSASLAARPDSLTWITDETAALTLPKARGHSDFTEVVNPQSWNSIGGVVARLVLLTQFDRHRRMKDAKTAADRDHAELLLVASTGVAADGTAIRTKALDDISRRITGSSFSSRRARKSATTHRLLANNPLPSPDHSPAQETLYRTTGMPRDMLDQLISAAVEDWAVAMSSVDL